MHELLLKTKGETGSEVGCRIAGKASPGNILISKIFAFVFKKRERSGAERNRTRKEESAREWNREGDDKERMKVPKQPYRIFSGSRNGDGGGWVVAMPVFKGLE